MKIISAILIFLAGLGAGVALQANRRAPAPPGPTVDLSVNDGGIYRVRKVVDGDTIVLENGLHIRYNGINAPERGHFVSDRAPLADEATARNIALVEGKQVRVKLAASPLDMHGRVCARIFLVPENPAASNEAEIEASAVLLREGLARAMGLGIAREDYGKFKAIEAQARAEKAGIWGLEEKLRADDGKPYCSAEKVPSIICAAVDRPSASA